MAKASAGSAGTLNKDSASTTAAWKTPTPPGATGTMKQRATTAVAKAAPAKGTSGQTAFTPNHVEVIMAPQKPIDNSKTGHTTAGLSMRARPRRQDRHVGPDHAAQRLEQRAFGIVLGRRDRRPMQRKTDAVELAGFLRGTDDHVADRLPAFFRERA